MDPNLVLSSPGSLKHGHNNSFIKRDLKRTQTLIGLKSETSNINATLNKPLFAKRNLSSIDYRDPSLNSHDENTNFGNSLRNSKYKNSPSAPLNNSYNGLQLRKSANDESVNQPVKFKFNPQTTSDHSLTTLMEHYSNAPSTLKADYCIDVVSKRNSFDVPSLELQEQKSIDIDSPRFVNVDLAIQHIELSDDTDPLNLENLASYVPYAGPFFQTHEFNPFEPTSTGILLKILNEEFELIEDDLYDNESDGLNDNFFDDLEKNATAKKLQKPWYREYFDKSISTVDQFIKSFKPLTKEEYNKKYPWDKFYDPELYYDSQTDDEEGVLNMDMIPDKLEGSINFESTTFKRKYSYLSKRKGF